MIIFVACDLYGTKHNVAFEFDTTPEFKELMQSVEQTFEQVADTRRPPGHPYLPFRIAAAQVYSEKEARWTNITSSTQLHDRCQMYVFQRDHGIHTDKQGTIPPAEFTITSHASKERGVSSVAKEAKIHSFTEKETFNEFKPSTLEFLPQSSFDRNSTEASPTMRSSELSRKATYVFETIDQNKNGTLEFSEVRSTLGKFGELGTQIIDVIFEISDQNRDGVISLNEWLAFVRTYAVALIEALYHRMTEQEEVQKLREIRNQSEEKLHSKKARESELRQMLNEAIRESQSAESNFLEVERSLKLKDDNRRRSEEKERVLIVKELDLLSRKIQLQREETHLREEVRHLYETGGSQRS